MGKSVLEKAMREERKANSSARASKDKKISKKIIDEADLVSFDMFDTLVERLVYQPSDVFSIVERKFDKLVGGKSDFKARRMGAESSLSKRNDGITTLDGIYEGMEGFSKEDKETLKKLELEVERKLIKAKKEGRELYEYAKSKGKTCILTSDMYLPKEFLKRVLNELGYFFDEYYVSGDIGLSKQNSKIFSFLLEKYAGRKIVHIGDSRRYDVDHARKKGIGTIYLRKDKKARRHYSLDESIVASFASHKSFAALSDSFGYKLLGPYMLGFVSFVDESKDGDLLFLSRDGHFMKRVYDILHPGNPSKYLYASRKAFIIPKLHFDSSFQNVRKSFAWPSFLSWDDFLEGLNIDSTIEGVDAAKKTPKDLFFTKQNEEIFNNYVRSALQEKADRQYEMLVKYIGRNVSSSKATLVDIGWRGNMQKAIEEMFPDLGISGLYTGILRKQSNYHGYMFDPKKSMKAFVRFDPCTAFFETLFLAPHGSTLGYKEEGDAVKPVLEELTEGYRKTYAQVLKMQDGCAEFIEDISYFSDVIEGKADFVSPLIGYLFRPDREFLAELSDLRVDFFGSNSLYAVFKGPLIKKIIAIAKSGGCQLYSMRMSLNGFEYRIFAALLKLANVCKIIF